MAFSTCPIAVVKAPAERVWNLLSEPVNYDQWWDAQTVPLHLRVPRSRDSVLRQGRPCSVDNGM